LAPHSAALRQDLLHGRGVALPRRLPVERDSMLEWATVFMSIGAQLGNACSQNAKSHVLGHPDGRARRRIDRHA
jgi:hypothetical protein